VQSIALNSEPAIEGEMRTASSRDPGCTFAGNVRSKLADWPAKGLLAHMAGPMPGGWRVVDVWQSEAAYKKFGKALMPVLKEVGIGDAEPKIFPLVRFIKA